MNMFLLLFTADLFCQSRSELEEQRKRTIKEISYVDELLRENKKEKSESLNDLEVLGKKLGLRENILRGLSDEIELLNNRIELNSLAIGMMESDINVLRKDIEKAVVSAFMASKGNSEICYILSSKDFNQAYKRLKYLQQVAGIRRNEMTVIEDLKDIIEKSKLRLEEDLSKISDLKQKEEGHKALLQGEKSKTQKILKSLTNKERQLKKELEEKKRIARKIENEITKVIENERNKIKDSPLKSDEVRLGNNFYENKGKLPWPVERGIITSHFGIQNHPVLKYVKEDNIDIEISSTGNTPVKSVFKGEIAKVFSIPGANTAVIIRHGKYMTVYQNLIDVKVKVGEKVETNEIIGKLFCDVDNGGRAVLKFMIFEDRVKLNPELWISKKN